MATNIEKIIRVYGREVQLKDGGSFVKFSYTKDGKTFYDVKFNKGCDQMPTSRGYWLITVLSEDVNVQRVKHEKGVRTNDILWIKQVQDLKKDKVYEEVKNSIKQSEVNALLHDVRDDEIGE